ncbi:MAG: hypothetical protein K2X35_01005 [Bryobacteraceae bacterium]|nr:hypothetical protein [Bryobacteraceae bacterium]
MVSCRGPVLPALAGDSLYLWQQLFLNRDGTAWVHFFPLNLILAAAAAAASYHLIETPMLDLRLRWEKRIFRRERT